MVIVSLCTHLKSIYDWAVTLIRLSCLGKFGDNFASSEENYLQIMRHQRRYIHTLVYIYVCVCLCVCVCMRARARVCVRVCVCT